MNLGWLAALLTGGVLVIDVFLPSISSYLVLGLLDEPAHLATTIIVLMGAGSIRRLPVPFVVGALIAGNAIDLDHTPLMLGYTILTAGTPRPYTHSLTTVALLLLFGLRTGSSAQASVGAATGVAVHLFRDASTAPVALAWPLTPSGVVLPHPAYVAVLVVCAASAVRRGSRCTWGALPLPAGAGAHCSGRREGGLRDPRLRGRRDAKGTS